jgi:hypothetical protein
VAITTLFATGYEDGVAPDATAGVKGGGLYDAIVNASGQLTSVTGGAQRSGTYALQNACLANTASYAYKTISSTKVVARRYVKFTSFPASNITVVCDVSDGTNHCIFEIRSTGVIGARCAAGTRQTGPTLLTGVWYCLEAQIDVSANPWTMDWRVDGVTQTQATGAVAASTLTRFLTGQYATSNQDAYTVTFDDEIVGSWTVAATDWYGGCLQGVALSPASDTAYNPDPVTHIRGGGASPAVISGSNTAWQYMDDVPLPTGTSPTSDRINQDTIAAGDYVAMANTASTAQLPLANCVRATLAYGGDSATTNKGSSVILDSAASETAVYGTSGTPADMSETTVFYKSVIVPPPAAGWSKTEIDALRWRIGYSNDVTPNPYWQALQLYVDYPYRSLVWQPAPPTVALM